KPRRKLAQAAVKLDDFARGEVLGERDALRQKAEATPGSAHARIHPRDRDGARCWKHQAGEAAQDGALAAPVRSQERERFAIVKTKRHAVHRDDLSKLLSKLTHFEHGWSP